MVLFPISIQSNNQRPSLVPLRINTGKKHHQTLPSPELEGGSWTQRCFLTRPLPESQARPSWWRSPRWLQQSHCAARLRSAPPPSDKKREGESPHKVHHRAHGCMNELYFIIKMSMFELFIFIPLGFAFGLDFEYFLRFILATAPSA